MPHEYGYGVLVLKSRNKYCSPKEMKGHEALDAWAKGCMDAHKIPYSEKLEVKYMNDQPKDATIWPRS